MQETKEFVVVRNFHMGEITESLSAGERLQFDGQNMIRVSNGKRYQVNTFPLLVKGRLIAEDDGTVEFKPAAQVKPRQPTLAVIIEDHNELVVADIKLPNKIAGRDRKPTEEIALSKTIENSKIIYDEQRVVGKANVRTASKPQPAIAKPSRMAIIEQEEDARPVRRIQNAQNTLTSALQAEGIGPLTKTGTNIISDTSDGIVIAKVKSYEERKAELAKAAVDERRALAEPIIVTEEEQMALQDDIRLALAKRAGQVPSGVRTSSVKPVPSEKIEEADDVVEEIPTASGTLKLDSMGFPIGFPRNDHWKKRIDWCKANRDNIDALRIIYTKSTDSFKSQMNTTFIELNLGPSVEV